MTQFPFCSDARAIPVHCDRHWPHLPVILSLYSPPTGEQDPNMLELHYLVGNPYFSRAGLEFYSQHKNHIANSESKALQLSGHHPGIDLPRNTKGCDPPVVETGPPKVWNEPPFSR